LYYIGTPGVAIKLLILQTSDKSKKFCPALFKNPPDKSVCKDEATGNLFGEQVSFKEFDFVRDPNSKRGGKFTREGDKEL